MQANKDYFKVIQITDTHLFKNAESLMFGLSSNCNFDAVMDQVKNTELHDADAIFLTGDLSQDETVESYSYLLERIELFNKPVYWLPGNHDSLTTMEKVFNKSNIFHRGTRIETPFWDFIFVDTKIDGRDSGYIADVELKRLSSELKLSKNKTALVMHHHPMFVNTPILDKYILENRDEFWNILNKFHVDLIMCGHVHNDYSFSFNNVSIETAPATSLQWKKGASQIAFEKKAGFKVYYFLENRYEAKTRIFETEEVI